MIDRSRVLCACIAHLWSRSYVKGSRSVVEEITSICADFPVELRGFEPRTSAVRAPARADGAAPSGCAGLTAAAAPLDPALEWPCFT
jgi:hypothetical protein